MTPYNRPHRSDRPKMSAGLTPLSGIAPVSAAAAMLLGYAVVLMPKTADHHAHHPISTFIDIGGGTVVVRINIK